MKMDPVMYDLNNYLYRMECEELLTQAAENEALLYMETSDPLYDKFVDYLAENVDYDYDYGDHEGYVAVWPSYESFMEQQEEGNE
jgi:hypothetical protein